MQAGEPDLGVLEGIVVAVELVGAVGTVAVAQGDVGDAEGVLQMGLGAELEIAVVAVVGEAVGEVAREGDGLGPGSEDEGAIGALLVGAEVAESEADGEVAGFGSAGDEVDRAAHGVGAVHGGTGAFENFDAVDGSDGNGEVHAVVAGLDVADAQAVEQDQGLAEVGAADGDVGLDAVGRALLQVDGGIELEEIDRGRWRAGRAGG